MKPEIGEINSIMTYSVQSWRREKAVYTHMYWVLSTEDASTLEFTLHLDQGEASLHGVSISSQTDKCKPLHLGIFPFWFTPVINYSSDEHRTLELWKAQVSLKYVWIKQALFTFKLAQKVRKAFTQVLDSQVWYMYSENVLLRFQLLVHLFIHFHSSLSPLCQDAFQVLIGG